MGVDLDAAGAGAGAALAPFTGGASLGLLAAGTGLAGAGVSAIGAIQSGEATAANDQYQAAVAANNAIIAKQNESWTIQSGETQATNEGLKTRAQLGTQKASQGAAGVDVNSGSAAAVRAGTGSMGMLDALTIRSNAARQAYGYAVQGTSDTAQAALDTRAAGQAVTAGEISGGASLLSGASTVGGRYAGYLNATQNPGGGATSPAAPAPIDPWES